MVGVNFLSFPSGVVFVLSPHLTSCVSSNPHITQHMVLWWCLCCSYIVERTLLERESLLMGKLI